jgi:hypothetical protein
MDETDIPFGRVPFFFQTMPFGASSFGDSNIQVDSTKIPTLKMDNKRGEISPYGAPTMGSASITLVNMLTLDTPNLKKVRPLPYYQIIEGDELHRPWDGVTILFRMIVSELTRVAYQIGEGEWQYNDSTQSKVYDYSRTFVASDFKLDAGLSPPNVYNGIFPYGQEIVTLERTETASGFPLPNYTQMTATLGPWNLVSITPPNYELG